MENVLEAGLPSRGLLVVCVVLLVLGAIAWREVSSRNQPREAADPVIIKQPVAFATHTFDPAAPPSDMPPLSPGESAECDSNFLSSASLRGETRQTDTAHATLTITQVKMTLQLRINIWVPATATQHVIEHEHGHQQISEYYYQGADKLAAQIAASYIGRKAEIAGTDLNAESNKILQQFANEITVEYGKELNPGPAQILYDSITDHGKNEVVAKDAVDHALKNAVIEAPAAKSAD